MSDAKIMGSNSTVGSMMDKVDIGQVNAPDVLQVGNLSEGASIPNPYRHRVYLRGGGVSPTINTYGGEHAPHIIVEEMSGDCTI